MTLLEYFKDWLKVIDLPELSKVVTKLNSLYSVKPVVPEYKDIFKAFTLCSEHDCKAVFLGQDPYPQKGVATGVLFGNKHDTLELSPSLEVIKESVMNLYRDSMPFKSFDITMESWARQGILMINSALTCEMNKIGSHVMLWRPFIAKLLKNLSECETGMVYVLFGNQAQTFEPYINNKFNTIIKARHPAFYARTNIPMPNDIFTEIDSIMINTYGTSIQWCTDL